jgi:Synaptotagmin-like mitochondrial-lipid-binding domain/C2 domain
MGSSSRSITGGGGGILYAAGGMLVGGIVTYYVLMIAERRRPISPFVRRRRMIDSSSSEASQQPLPAAAANLHIDFLTGIVAQLWDYINPAGSAMIRETLEPMLAEYNMSLLNVDLGQTPLLIDNVIVHEHNKDSGFVQFDLDIIWDAACNIQIKSSLGKFGLRSIQLGGRLSMVLKPLTGALPCVGAIQYAFINPPHLELDFSGLAAVADVSFIDATVQAMLHDTLADMVVLPHRMVYKVNPSCCLFDVYEPPIGVLRFAVVSGRDFQVEKKALKAADIPDVYCVVEMGNQKPLRTPTIQNCLNPVWENGGCAMDFLAFDHDQIVTFKVWDEDSGLMDEDDELGWCQTTIRDMLLAKGRTKEMELLTDDNDQGTGAFLTVRCDLCPLTTDLNSLEQTDALLLGGLITILVTKAFDIPLAQKDAATFVKVTVTGTKNFEFVTSIVADTPGVDSLNPLYDGVFHVPLQNGKPNVVLTLMNGKDQVLGSTTVAYDALINSPDMVVRGRHAIGQGGASLECSISLRGVKQPKKKVKTKKDTAAIHLNPPTGIVSTGHASSSPSSTPSPITVLPTKMIGNVQVTVEKGAGFAIRKRRFNKDDIPDVYVKLRFGNAPIWMTSVVKDSTHPEWNESKNFPLASHSETMSIDAYDKNKGAMDKDTYLGSARVTVSRILLSGHGEDLHVMRNGVKTGAIITIRCDLLE